MKATAKRLLFAIALGACSPPNVANSSGSAACADYAYAYCTRVAQCSQTVFQLRYADERTCETSISTVCTNSVNAPHVGATPALEEACSLAIPRWSCVDLLDNTANPPPECMLPAGLVPDGQACAFAGQCQGGFCAIDPTALCGTCATPPQAGDPCTNLSTCGRGMACESGICTTFGLIGGACGPALCTTGLACSNGTCQQPTEIQGAPCGGSDGRLCDFQSGLTCNTQTNVCEPVHFAGAGGACGTVGGTHYECSSGASCINGTCDAVSATGGPCDTTVGPDCAEGARCIVTTSGSTTGVCMYPDSSGCQ